MTSTALAVLGNVTSIVNDDRQAIVRYIDEKRDLIRRNLAPKASDAEFELWIEECKFRALNPLARHIYLLPIDGKHVTSVAIDGLRLIAARTGEYAGSDEYIYDTETAANPNKASCTIYRLVQGQRVPFTASVFWKERVKQSKTWREQPYHMLGKAAEAAALRKGFPEECGGLYSDDEIGEAYVNAPAREVRTGAIPVQVQRGPVGGSSRSQLRETVANVTARPMKATVTPAQEAISEEEPVYGMDGEGTTLPFSPATAALLNELNDLAGRNFDLERYLHRVHPNRTVDELTDEELTQAVEIGRKSAKK